VCRTPVEKSASALELHPVEAVEQSAGVLVVTSLVVGAQKPSAHASELLARDLCILLTLELVPKALVGLTAIQLALGERRRDGRACFGGDASAVPPVRGSHRIR